MTHFQLPTIRGTIEQQLKQIVSYLTNQAEKLNYNVDNSSAEKIFEQAVQAVSSNTDEPDKDYYDSRYVSLKSLIIKTADEVSKQQDSKSLTLAGEYLAKSEFGEYFEKATVNIEGTPYGISELYKYSTKIKTNLETYQTDTMNFIHTGYLDTSGSSPEFGIEVGLLSDTFTFTDDSTGETQTILNDNPHKIRITPGKISLFCSTCKDPAAYIEKDQIHFPKANITGGTINISSGTFKVDNDGNLIAKSGSIAGWNIGKGSLCYPNDNAIYKSTSVDEDGYRYEVGIKSEMGSVNYNNFYVARYNTKDGTNKRVFAVGNSGAILATKGKISGWSIGEAPLLGVDAIYSTAGDYEIGMQGSDNESGVAFYVKHKTDGDIFYVRNNGTLKATKAEITGKITATSGSFTGSIYAAEGTIGGFDIKSSYMITTGCSDFGIDECLYFNPKGSVASRKIGGLSTAISGWTIASGKNFGVTKNGNLYAKNARIAGTIIASEGLIGGFDIGSSYLITKDCTEIGKSGCLYFNPSGSNKPASIAGSDNVSGWMIAAGTNFGVLTSGKVYANGVNLRGSFMSTAGKLRSVIAGGIIQLQHNISTTDENWVTYGMISSGIGTLRLKGVDTIYYRGYTHTFAKPNEDSPSDESKDIEYAKMYTGSQSTSAGTRYFDVTNSILCVKAVDDRSDRRLKENIVNIDERFESMFSDLTAYSYNFIGENDISVGFVAQDVQHILSKYGIENFNVINTVPTDIPGFDGYRLGLNYLKFIPLNTHMIQKCLKKIEALENEILLLKNERIA